MQIFSFLANRLNVTESVQARQTGSLGAGRDRQAGNQ